MNRGRSKRELAPCPYSDDTEVKMVREESLGPPWYYVKSPSGGSGPTATTEAEAARLWNERPREKQAERRVAELEAELEKVNKGG